MDNTSQAVLTSKNNVCSIRVFCERGDYNTVKTLKILVLLFLVIEPVYVEMSVHIIEMFVHVLLFTLLQM